jgi:hypothetical protein
MRITLVLFLFLAGCDLLNKDEETPSVQLAFIPSQCTFVQTTTLPGVSGPVDEYSCAMYSKMTCVAYAQDTTYLGIECVVTDPAQPQGVPSGCTAHVPLAGGHGFLDGFYDNSVDGYRCGVVNNNLNCAYYKHSGPPLREEVRCHLL